MDGLANGLSCWNGSRFNILGRHGGCEGFGGGVGGLARLLELTHHESSELLCIHITFLDFTYYDLGLLDSFIVLYLLVQQLVLSDDFGLFISVLLSLLSFDCELDLRLLLLFLVDFGLDLVEDAPLLRERLTFGGAVQILKLSVLRIKLDEVLALRLSVTMVVVVLVAMVAQRREVGGLRGSCEEGYHSEDLGILHLLYNN